MRLARSLAFSDLTSVMARHVAFFLPTTAPRRALESDGSHTTISMGSTSWASTTSLAFFSSMSVVTWLMPILHETGRLEDALPPAATAAASALRRSFFSVRVSGLRLFRRRKSCDAWRLSKVLENWLMAGGTLMRLRSVILARWRRTYLGHLTKRVRSRPLGRMSPPMEKVRGFFSTADLGNATLGAVPLATFFTIFSVSPC